MTKNSTLAFVSLLIFIGCGGGTAGTSGTGARFLSGQVKTVRGEPLPGVTMEATSEEGFGDASVTDAEGRFGMELAGAQFTVRLKDRERDDTVAFQAELPAPSNFGVEANVQSDGRVTANVIESAVRILGECSVAFEVGTEVSQIQSFDSEKSCSLRILSGQREGGGIFQIISACSRQPVAAGTVRRSSELPIKQLLSDTCREFAIEVSREDGGVAAVTALRLLDK
jgi:hypothetical protein